MEKLTDSATSLEVKQPAQEKMEYLNSSSHHQGDDFHNSKTKEDIDKAAEQVLNDWSERLQGSSVFDEPDEEHPGELSNSLPAGGFEEVLMGYEEHDDDEEEIVEEEIVDESYSEELIEDDDHRQMMDDNDLQEIMDETAEMMDHSPPPASHIDEGAEQTFQESQPSLNDVSDYDSEPEQQVDEEHEEEDEEESLRHSSEPEQQVDEEHEEGEDEEESRHSYKYDTYQDTAQGVAPNQAHDEPSGHNDSQEVEYIDETVLVHEEEKKSSEPRIDMKKKAKTGPVDNTDSYMRQYQRLQDSQDLEAQSQTPPMAANKQPGKPEAPKKKRQQERYEEKQPVMLYAFVCVICLVVIALAVALPLVLMKDDDEAKSPEVTRFPTVSPTVSTPAPTRLSTGWVKSINPVFGQEQSKFGTSIALHGNYSAVGAPMQNDTQGAVYGFFFENGAWNIIASVVGPEKGAMFGSAVDLSDKQMVVGAPNTKVINSPVPAGAVYLFAHDPDTNTWEQIGPELHTEEGVTDANGEFGAAVGIGKADLPRVVIGAPKASLDLKTYQNGRVYTFESSSIAWNPLESTPLFGKNADDWFGSAVDMCSDGSCFIAGAPGNDFSFAGYFQIYEYKDGDWNVVYEEDGSTGENFGSEVVVLAGNDIFAVGGPGYQNGAGRVVVYQKNENSEYDIIGEIIGEPGDRLGEPGSIGGGYDDEGLLIVVATSYGDVLTYGYVEEEKHWVQRVEPLAASADVIAFSAETGLLTSTPEKDMVSLYETGDVYVTGKKPEPLQVATLSPTLAPVANSPTDAPVAFPVTEPPVMGAPVTSAPTSLFTAAPVVATQAPETEAPTASLNAITEVPAASTSSPTMVPEDDGSGSALTWSETAGPFLPKADDTEYGFSLSLSSQTLAIGAPATLGRGAVLLFEKTDGVWGSIASEQAFGEIPGERFGSAVDVTTRFAIVGAPDAVLEGTPTATGAAYCFVLSSRSWKKLGPTVRGDSGIFGTDEKFGFSVATSTNGRIVIGAPGSSLDSVTKRGRVYVYEFELVTTSWSLVYNSTGLDAGDALGFAVDMTSDGRGFFVGAPGGDIVEVYELKNAVWSKTQTLEGETGESFGTSVQVISPNGDLVAVGAPNHADGKGRVVVYQRDNSGTFVQLGSAIIGANGEQFGGARAISGFEDSPSVVVAANGLVRRFDYDMDTEKWKQVGNTLDSGFGDQLSAVAVSEASMIVGGNNDAAYYELAR